MTFPTQKYLDQLASAVAAEKISQSAAAYITQWLTEEHYAPYHHQIADHIRQNKWATLQDVFWTEIPFGTAGRRGKMYPIGCNAINERTIGETVQALAEHVRESYDGPLPATCAIAYDTRHRSIDFAKLCAEIMVAHDFDVLFFEGFRSTPLLATTVRYKGCACGIMVSASHNPPSDNAAKVFWSTGGQLKSPHDAQVTEKMRSVTDFKKVPFDDALKAGRIHYVAAEMDGVYREAVLNEGFGIGRGSRDLKILYSPVHGVGATSVVPVLAADGFEDVEVYGPHAEPNGGFPNVPDNIANPENPALFDALSERAKAAGFDLVIASDPDADRLGCAAPLKLGSDDWLPINGNQIAVLLTEYVLRHRSQGDSLSPDHFVVKTLVTTNMISAIAESYGIRAIGECLTGFKWIGSLIDEHGPDKFILGAEEAHGYLIGTHCRDKDGAVAAMLLAEFAAEAKSAGRSLHEELDLLYEKHGYHSEKTIAKKMPGADGMERMQSIMASLRESPPDSIGGMKVTEVRDYLNGHVVGDDGNTTPMEDAPTGNLLVMRTDVAGNYVAVRPSGTEPKIKFYMFAFEQPGDVEAGKKNSRERIAKMEEDLLAIGQ